MKIKSCKLFSVFLLLLFLFIHPGRIYAASDRDRLVISFPASQISFNPLYSYTSTEAQIYTAIFEGLVTYDPLTLHPRSGAAESWTISSDKKEYLFQLRTDTYFWDGIKVTAESFRDSWLKLLDPGDNAPYGFLLDIVEGARDYRTGAINDPSLVGITAVEKYVLKVKLETPAEHFLKILCHHSFVPVHPSFLEKKEWSELSSAPGNGPYYIYKKAADSIVLKKNILYWDSRNVDIPEIVILFTDNPIETTEDFNNGKIHWAAGSFYLENVINKKHIVFNNTFATTYYFFKSSVSPWNNPDFRKAFLLSSPLEKIRDKNFIFYPAATLVPMIPDYPAVTGIEKQNIPLSEKYFRKSSETDLPRIVIKIPESGETIRTASLFKEAWEKFPGTAVEIKTFPFDDYYDELKKDDYTLGIVSWIGDFPDPLTFLKMWTTDSTLNDSGFSNPLFDTALKNSMNMSGKERYSLLAEAEQILIDSAALIPVSNSPSINLVNTSKIRGWYPNPLDIHPFKYFSFIRERLNPGLAYRKTDFPHPFDYHACFRYNH